MKDQSNRTHLIKAYLNDSEYERFCRMAEATKRSNSDLVRRLLQTSVFVEFPPVEYREIIDQLERIGINLNQLAYKANSLGFIDELQYRKNANEVAVRSLSCFCHTTKTFVFAIIQIGFDKVCSVTLIFHFLFSFVAKI